MLELPEECPDYDYGLKVRSKEQQAAADTAVAGTYHQECADYDHGLKVRSKEQQAAVDTAVAGTVPISGA